jgi:hypothetical protein
LRRADEHGAREQVRRATRQHEGPDGGDNRPADDGEAENEEKDSDGDHHLRDDSFR